MTRLRVTLLAMFTALTALWGVACNDEIPSEADGPVTSAPPSGTLFLESAEAAGLTYIQFEAQEPGNCLFDNISRPTEEERHRTLCDAERMTGGAAAGDFDGDGAIDLIVTRMDGHDLLFRNRGDGQFEEVSESSGLSRWELATNGAAWGDIDNDGDLDLFVTTVGDTRHYLFVNEGGVFAEEGIERGAAVDTGDRRIGFSATFGDYDLDGYLDLHVTEWRPSQLVGEAVAGVRLLRNLGAERPGHFEDLTETAGVGMDQVVSQTQSELTEGTFAFGSTFVDLDNDGWPELAVASDFGTSRLFWNNGDGTFSDGTLDARVGTAQNAMGTTFGDYDADGDLDWFVTSVFSFRTGSPGSGEQGLRDGNRLFRNDGDRRFTDATDRAGVRNGSWGWGAAFFDADNDGDLDLTMTNGMEMMPGFDADATRYWENDGSGRFRSRNTDVGLDDIEDGKGLLVFDADNDGDLDVFVVNNASGPLFYRNQSAGAGSWLRVSLAGVTSNRQGLGARVSVFADGLPEQIREAGVSTHFLGQSEDAMHFGLAESESADLVIRWPASGLVTTLNDVPADSWIRVVEGESGYEVLNP
ncbi:MAG: VCBS repeat-containing protein [Chloroflexi bacterium]|nr:VCBS repeat-containing protein [Chloroflexota bacterium]MCY3696449.1 VCBS repeat-containing protein [Chloroflexota bacterium]